MAWKFMEETGIPTDKCVSYTSGGGDSGTCPDTCDDGSEITTFHAQSYQLFMDISMLNKLHS